MLSFYGGESYLYGDGMETVTAVIDSKNKVKFSFETYKDAGVTNVKQGVINKLFFRPLWGFLPYSSSPRIEILCCDWLTCSKMVADKNDFILDLFFMFKNKYV